MNTSFVINRYYSSVKRVFNGVHNKQAKSNLSKDDKKSLKKLQTKPFVYLPSDKGGEFCVIQENDYSNLGFEH